jgi:hypothetical protein
MKSDETVGRYPDGSRDVFTMNVPTIGKTNIVGSYSESVEQPVTNGIHDMMAEQQIQQSSSRIYNLQGQAVQGNLAPGIYIINGKKVKK